MRQARPDDNGLSLLDPVVEGARAVVERHRAYCARARGQTRGGDSSPEKNSARESAPIDQIHSAVPPSIEPGRGLGQLL
jgi:hypothetical protein